MQLIGKINSIHGLKGEIIFSHQLSPTSKFETWDALMVELNPKSFIPFFIEDIRTINDEECICKFEEINNREQAKLVLNKNIYASRNFSIEQTKLFSIQQYHGFTLYDKQLLIGKIIDTMNSKVNAMLVISRNEKEILVPLQEIFIEKIDIPSQKIFMNLPEGLLDI